MVDGDVMLHVETVEGYKFKNAMHTFLSRVDHVFGRLGLFMVEELTVDHEHKAILLVVRLVFNSEVVFHITNHYSANEDREYRTSLGDAQTGIIVKVSAKPSYYDGTMSYDDIVLDVADYFENALSRLAVSTTYDGYNLGCVAIIDPNSFYGRCLVY